MSRVAKLTGTGEADLVVSLATSLSLRLESRLESEKGEMMKHAKILGLMVVAAAAFMAFAATASATVYTSNGSVYTGTIKATSTNSALDGAFTTVTCSNSTVEGSVESHGAGVTAKGKITTLDFTGCNFPVTVESNGTLETHAIKQKTEPHAACAAKPCDATTTSSGAKVKISTSVGTCVFTTNNTSVGTLTSSSTTGKTAVMHIQGTIPRTEGNFLCGTSGTWTGSYTIESPDNLDIDP